MLKFQHKKEQLNFTTAWVTSERQMVDDDLEDNILRQLVEGNNFQDILDRVIRSINRDED